MELKMIPLQLKQDPDHRPLQPPWLTDAVFFATFMLFLSFIKASLDGILISSWFPTHFLSPFPFITFYPLANLLIKLFYPALWGQRFCQADMSLLHRTMPALIEAYLRNARKYVQSLTDCPVLLSSNILECQHYQWLLAWRVYIK